MSGSEIWERFVEFFHALPAWLSALPVWLTTLLTLAVGFWIGRVVRTRSTKLMEQKAARETLLLAMEAMKIDPTFRAIPGLGQTVLDQLKRQKRLKIPLELEQRLKGAGKDGAKPAPRVEAASVTMKREGAAVTEAKAVTPTKPIAREDSTPTEPPAETSDAVPEPEAEEQETAPDSEAEKADATSEPKPDVSDAAPAPEAGTEEAEKTKPARSPFFRRSDH